MTMIDSFFRNGYEIKIGVNFLIFLGVLLYFIVHISYGIISHRSSVKRVKEDDVFVLFFMFIYNVFFSFPNMIICCVLYLFLYISVCVFNLIVSTDETNSIKNFQFKNVFLCNINDAFYMNPHDLGFVFLLFLTSTISYIGSLWTILDLNSGLHVPKIVLLLLFAPFYTNGFFMLLDKRIMLKRNILG